MYSVGMAAREGCNNSNAELLEKLYQLIKKADDLCERCSKMQHVQGMSKVQKRCQAEKRFLQGVSIYNTDFLLLFSPRIMKGLHQKI